MYGAGDVRIEDVPDPALLPSLMTLTDVFCTGHHAAVTAPIGLDMIMRNITLTGGVDPARHYIDGILPDVLEGRIESGRVFDRTVGLDGVPDGYRAMASRQSLKVLITP